MSTDQPSNVMPNTMPLFMLCVVPRCCGGDTNRVVLRAAVLQYIAGVMVLHEEILKQGISDSWCT
jgi:hypothetical protein